MSDSEQHSTVAFQYLVPDEILDSIESQGYRCNGLFLALNSYENRVYQLGVEDGPPVVCKIYRPNRWSDDAILEEHEFAYQLADKDITVSLPLVINDKTMNTIDGYRSRCCIYFNSGFYINNQVLPAVLRILEAFGYRAEDLRYQKTRQLGLGAWLKPKKGKK